MASTDTTIEALQDQLSKLTLRVKELSEENQDLRDICDERGIEYKERLALRRHSRYFAQLRVDHPIGETATAADLLGAATIVKGIAEHAGSVLCTGMLARCFFVAISLVVSSSTSAISSTSRETRTPHCAMSP